MGGKEETTIYDMAKIIGNRFDKEIVKGKVNNDVASSAPKKVSISLDRYEDEFGDFEFTTFEDGMSNQQEIFFDKIILNQDNITTAYSTVKNNNPFHIDSKFNFKGSICRVINSS